MSARNAFLILATLASLATACRRSPTTRPVLTLTPAVYPSARPLVGTWRIRFELAASDSVRLGSQRPWAEGHLVLDTVPRLPASARASAGTAHDSALVRGRLAIDFAGLLPHNPPAFDAGARLSVHGDSVSVGIGSGCSDCGALYLEGRFYGDSAAGEWGQLFGLDGDAAAHGHFRLWRQGQ